MYDFKEWWRKTRFEIWLNLGNFLQKILGADALERYDLGGLVPRTSAKSSFFKVLKMKFLVDPGEEDEPLLSCSLFHIVSIDPILPLIFI